MSTAEAIKGSSAACGHAARLAELVERLVAADENREHERVGDLITDCGAAAKAMREAIEKGAR